MTRSRWSLCNRLVAATVALELALVLTVAFARQGGAPGARIPGLAPTTRQAFTPLVLRGPALPGTARPSWGAPIAVSPRDGSVWVVNPDADSVSVVDPLQLTNLAELRVGREPWSIALAPDGREAYVVERAAGTLSAIDTATLRLRATIDVGPEPGMVALSPSGTTAYVTVGSSAELVAVSVPSFAISARVHTPPQPYAIAVSNDGDGDDGDERVYVTHFGALPRAGGVEATDNGRQGQVTVFDAGTLTLAQEIALAADEHGFPNLLAGIALSEQRAWVPHVRAAPALPNGLSTTVFAAVAAIERATGTEDQAARILLNDELNFGSPVNNPLAVVPSYDARTLYVVLAGSDLVEVVDISTPTAPRLVKFLPVGTNPRGIVLSADGRSGFVMNYLARSVTVLDLERHAVHGTVAVTEETLDAPVLAGKRLFNSAVNPQMARGSWISCASCHADGGTDGVTWMFPDGPRQTPPLWNAARTLPWHWSAALDELQDVEDTVQAIQLGLGLAPGADPPLLGPPNAGRSADLDALAAYLERGIRVPTVAAPAQNSVEGRQLFATAGCVACHAGPEWTISTRPGPPGILDGDGNGMVDAMLRDVGTATARDIRGATGFDVPSLLGVGLTAPYLHDGSAADLRGLLAGGHPSPDDRGKVLSSEQITALVAFVQAIGPRTPPVAP